MNISVVIPLYNKEAHIERAIKSCLEQSAAVHEIIVVDDGSTDNGVKVVEKINDTRIIILRKKNGGVSSARNLGVKSAKTEIVAFLDADDYWHRNFIERIKCLEKNFPECAIFGTSYAYMSGQFCRDAKIKLVPHFGVIDEFIVPFSAGDCPILPSSTAIRKQEFELLGGFNDCWGEDIDLWLRFTEQYKLAYCHETLCFYSMDSENKTSNNHRNYSSDLFFFEWLRIRTGSENPLARYYKKALARGLQNVAATNIRLGSFASASQFLWRKEAAYPTSAILRIAKSIVLRVIQLFGLRK